MAHMRNLTSHVRLFLFLGGIMKNKAFSKLSVPEREQKIYAALDRKTRGLLLPHELKSISGAVSLKQQYTLRFYRNDQEYWRVLSRDRSIRIRPVLTPKTPLDASAVVTWSIRDPHGSRQLHVYIPPTRSMKGLNLHEQQRIQTSYGL